MLNPCHPCINEGAPCEQCEFGWKSAEYCHEKMKKLLIALENGEKPVGWGCVERYKKFHPDWRNEISDK